MGLVNPLEHDDWKLGRVRITESENYTVIDVDGRCLYFNRDGSFDGTSIDMRHEDAVQAVEKDRQVARS